MGLILKSVGSYISAEISDAKSARKMYQKALEAVMPTNLSTKWILLGKLVKDEFKGTTSRDERLDEKQGGHPFYSQGHESSSPGGDRADFYPCWPPSGVPALYQGFWNKT